MNFKKILLSFNLILICFATIVIGQVNTQKGEKYKPEVRTVTYEEKLLNNEDYYKDFDDYSIEENNNGFKINLKKRFNRDAFDAIDLVGIDSNQENVFVEYEFVYYESESRIDLSVKIDENGTELTEVIPGLITNNEKGEADVLFADEEGIIWLSDLVDDSLINNAGWWNRFKNWIKSVGSEIVNVIVKGLRFSLNIVVNIIGLENGAKILSMYKDAYGIYHADFEAWQWIAGYNDLYDFVFNLGSSMQADKNEFLDENSDGLSDYILWGWKGDYWELGAGGELGIYKRLGNSEIWYVDRDLAIDMTLKVKYRTFSYNAWTNIIDWDPKDYYQNDYSQQKQWWITGFNPNYANKGIKKEQLRVEFTVKFVTKGYSSSFDKKLENAFKSRWVDFEQKWSFNSQNSTFSYAF